MVGYLNARHRQHVWLTQSIICGQPAVSTNAGLKFQRLDVWEFVAIEGGGSRPLAGLRSGRLASPRFTSRISAGRSVAWRPYGLLHRHGLNTRARSQFTSVRLGAACSARLPTKWASPKLERPPVASSSARSHLRATRQDAAPLWGLALPTTLRGQSRAHAVRASTHARWRVVRGWGRRFARTNPCAMLGHRAPRRVWFRPCSGARVPNHIQPMPGRHRLDRYACLLCGQSRHAWPTGVGHPAEQHCACKKNKGMTEIGEEQWTYQQHNLRRS